MTAIGASDALAETVNGYYKAELIRGPARQGPWRSVEEVELATLSWVHWHNTTRLHGYLNDVPPSEFEEAFYAAAGSDHTQVNTIARASMRARATHRRAHAVHPITGLQSEDSLWTYDPEGELLAVLRELGIGFVAYSPLGRGFLTGSITSPADLGDSDARKGHPRFTQVVAAVAVLQRRGGGRILG